MAGARQVYRYTEAEDRFIAENYGKMTALAIAARLGRAHASIRGRAKKLGVTGTISRRKDPRNKQAWAQPSTTLAARTVMAKAPEVPPEWLDRARARLRQYDPALRT